MSKKVNLLMVMLCATGLGALLISSNSSAHVTVNNEICEDLVKTMPNKTINGGTSGKHHCRVVWDTLNNYPPLGVYTKRHGCVYAGSQKYLVRHLPGNDKYGVPYSLSPEGFKYLYFWDCRVGQ